MMQMKWYVKEDMCDECYENKVCVVIKPHGCYEYGQCNDEIELCKECFDKKINELIESHHSKTQGKG